MVACVRVACAAERWNAIVIAVAYEKILLCDIMALVIGNLRGVTANEQPSQTAVTAAAARAAHLTVDDQPHIFSDHLAATLLGEQADGLINYHRLHGSHVVLAGARGQVTCRSRYAEDQLARAAGHGLTQYVILGAGLDTFASRSPLAASLTVFEADHPATQDWKRRQLAAAGLPAPACLTYVPLDLEAGPVTSSLVSSGLDPARPAFISWLGVTMYLTREVISGVIADLSQLAPGTELVTDYLLTADLRDADGATYADLVMPSAAEWGEPWLSCFTPEQMSGLFIEHGFAEPAHIRQRDAISPVLWQRTDVLHPIDLSVLAHAVIR
jgi:methyltransferase (TIGR00027 family)